MNRQIVNERMGKVPFASPAASLNDDVGRPIDGVPDNATGIRIVAACRTGRALMPGGDQDR
ncbi:MAG: hypothetical protein H0T93_00215 [Chloroflexia bacterium]|nr:hypothetical protein [Chloroflexia bacterium]